MFPRKERGNFISVWPESLKFKLQITVRCCVYCIRMKVSIKELTMEQESDNEK